MHLQLADRRKGRPDRVAMGVLTGILAALCAFGSLEAQAQPVPSLLLRAEPAGVASSTPSVGGSDLQELRLRQQALLERTMRAPTDYEATYEYVAVSIRLKDNEAAIGALERLVNYNPNLARANYELGKLYFELGSYDAAVRYLRIAAASPTIEPETLGRAGTLYPEAVKQQGQSRWFGFIQAGLRYQSNATFIPSGGLVRLNGQDFFLSPDARRRPDGSVFGLVQLGNDFDLQNQRGDILETRFLGFGSKQFRASDFDFGFVEASFGPRFGIPEIMPGASVKPYVVGQTAALRGERVPYVSSGGGGVTLRLPAFTNMTFEPGVEVRSISVRDRDINAISTLSDGLGVAGYLLSNAKITDTIDIEMRVIGIRNDSRLPWQSFGKFAWNVAANLQFDPPSSLIPRKWKVSPFIGGAILDFDRANPAVDPFVTRRDTEFRTGVVLDAPLTSMFGITAVVYYDRINSNLPNYRQHDLTVLGGPVARF